MVAVAVGLLMSTVLCANAKAAMLNILLTPGESGGTLVEISGDANGSGSSGNSSAWFNLEGGDPFDDSLQFASFDLATPIAFDGGPTIIALSFDSDGSLNSQDDFTIIMDGSPFDNEDPYTIAGSSLMPDLDFSLLNPGVYTRENTTAFMTLTIAGSVPAPVPLPPAIWLFASGIAMLYLRASDLCRRKS